MLTGLSITNYAIIDELNVNFERGFNVITGETGAGKSIMMGALSLVIGKRADTSVLFDPSKKCIVEAAFNLSKLSLQPFFISNDLDYENDTIIRREISTSGKSRAFINDTPVTLQQLKELTYYLIDIHSQHQTLLFNASDFQFNILDAFSGLKANNSNYSEKFLVFQTVKKELEILLNQNQKSNDDIDYYQFQFDELDKVNLVAGEQEKLEEEAEILNNADQIKEKLYQVSALLENEGGLTEQTKSIVNVLSELKKFSPSLQDFYERLNSINIELNDLSSENEDLKDSFEVDRERLEFVTSRLDELYKLEQKHRVTSVEELIALKDKFETKLVSVSDMSIKIDQLKLVIQKLFDELMVLAKEISLIRLKNIIPLKKQIETYLFQLGMPDAEIKIVLNQSDKLSINGIDTIEFLFSANKGGQLTNISKVASGGELSRLMLSIKTIISNKSNLPTIIFDEIDTGVSGLIADKMAEIMKQLSVDTQVFSITHLPQIAAKGNTHYVVYKDSTTDRTYSNLRKVSELERIDVIAKMLSGEKVTQAAIDNASELLKT